MTGGTLPEHLKARRNKTPAEKVAYYQHTSQLPIWVKRAIRKHDTLGITWPVVAKSIGKSVKTLQNWARTPAAKTFRKAIREVADDPVAIARLVAKHDAPSVLDDLYEQREAAKAAGDLAEWGRAARHLATLAQIELPKNVAPVAPILHLTINGGSVLEATVIPEGDSTSMKVIEAEIVNE